MIEQDGNNDLEITTEDIVGGGAVSDSDNELNKEHEKKKKKKVKRKRRKKLGRPKKRGPKKKRKRPKKPGPKKKGGPKRKPRKPGPKPKPKKRGRKPKPKKRGRPPKVVKEPEPEPLTAAELKKIQHIKRMKRIAYCNKYRRIKKKEKTNELINCIFDKAANDLGYIYKDKDLLLQHIKFISTSSWTTHPTNLDKYVVTSGKSEGQKPRSFSMFEIRYKYIYDLWVYLIKSCLEPTYPTYSLFGARGICITRDFLNAKRFCKWCLINGLTNKQGTFERYLVRRDKKGNYSPVNCYVVSEKEIHSGRSMKIVLDQIYLAKRYKEWHHPTVSYVTAYARYYLWDWDVEDAISIEYSGKVTDDLTSSQYGFSKRRFYAACADENSCSLQTFVSRIYALRDRGYELNHVPYDLLKKDLTERDLAAYGNKISSGQSSKNNRLNPYQLKNVDLLTDLISDDNDVYSDGNNVYSECPETIL